MNEIIQAISADDALDQFARTHGGIVGRGQDGSIHVRHLPGRYVAESCGWEGGFAEAEGLPTIILPARWKIIKVYS